MGALDRSAGTNWVEQSGGLPAYIEKIAKSLHEKRGFTISRAIATAVSMCKRWAAGGEDVNPDTRAKAAAAIAEWEAKRAAARGRSVDMSHTDALAALDLSAIDDELAVLDLAYGDHRPPYDWKHGYVPISPQAARIKAKKEAAPRGSRGGSSVPSGAGVGRGVKRAAAAKKATPPKRKPAVAGAQRPQASAQARDAVQRGRATETERQQVAAADAPRKSILPDPRPARPVSDYDREQQAKRDKIAAEVAERGRVRRGESSFPSRPSTPSSTPTIAAVSSTDIVPSRVGQSPVRRPDGPPAASPADEARAAIRAARTPGLNINEQAEATRKARAAAKRAGLDFDQVDEQERAKLYERRNGQFQLREDATEARKQAAANHRRQAAELRKQGREQDAKYQEAQAAQYDDVDPSGIGSSGRDRQDEAAAKGRALAERAKARREAEGKLAENDRQRADLDKREAASKAAVERADKARAANNDPKELRAAADELRAHNRNVYADQLERRAQVLEGTRQVDPEPATPRRSSLRDDLGGDVSRLDPADVQAKALRDADITRVNALAREGNAAAIAEQKRRQTPAYKRAQAKKYAEGDARYQAARKERRDRDERERPAREEAANKARRERDAEVQKAAAERDAKAKQQRAEQQARAAEQRKPAEDEFQARVDAGEFPMQRRPWSQIPADYKTGTGQNRRVMVAGPNGSTLVPYVGPERPDSDKVAMQRAAAGDLSARSTADLQKIRTNTKLPREQREAAAAELRKRNGPSGIGDQAPGAQEVERQRQARERPNLDAGPTRLTPEVTARMSDAQLEATLDRLAEAGDFTSPAFKAVEAEQNKRDDAKAAARRAEGNRPRR